MVKSYLERITTRYKTGISREHSYRGDLQQLLQELNPSILATNEPARIACGAPDYIITQNDLPIGYIEAKDIGISLKKTAKSEQLTRYLASLDNLILTDYLEFRWYVDGELRQESRLAIPQANGKLKTNKDGIREVEELLRNFLILTFCVEIR